VKCQTLSHIVEFRIPGFENVHPRGYFHCLALSGKDSREWYKDFIELCSDKIGGGFFPVCRLGDGEFEFCIGKWISPAKQVNESLHGYIYRKLRDRVTHMRSHYFKLGDRLAGHYTKDEWKQNRNKAAATLREISEIGVICPNFEYDDVQFAQQYYRPMLNWFSINNIRLTERNYFSFFFIYAMMSGPDRFRLLTNRNVLVVTNFDAAKKQNIQKSLLSDGCRTVQFVNISAERTLYDTIDLSEIIHPLDIVLLGAGVGKFNIIPQLRGTNTICLDIGFIMEIYANPDIKHDKLMTRVFTVCDHEDDPVCLKS